MEKRIRTWHVFHPPHTRGVQSLKTTLALATKPIANNVTIEKIKGKKVHPQIDPWAQSDARPSIQ